MLTAPALRQEGLAMLLGQGRQGVLALAYTETALAVQETQSNLLRR